MNATVVLSLTSAVVFSTAALVLIQRKKNINLSASVFIPLLLSILLYDFIVCSNVLEHSGITDYFDPLEDLAEIVFTFVFLFFVYNWRKDQSEARFRELFRLSPMSLAEIARDGRIIEINDIMAKNLYEFYGLTIDAVPTLDHWFELAYPDLAYRTKIQSTFRRAVDLAYQTGAEIKPDEQEITCRDSTKRTMIVNTSIIGKNILFSMVDITDRKREETGQVENLELLRATFNATPDGILVVNRGRKVTQANQQFYRMWRIPEQLQNLDDAIVLRDSVKDQLDDPVSFENSIESLLMSQLRGVFEVPFKDGRVFECYSAPMVLDEKQIGRVWDFRDVTKQKEAEGERGKLQNQLLQSQKLEAIGILAGGVAHDFNNMLGTIIGYAELTMTDMDADNPFRDNIAKILDAADRSAGLIRQLLIFARKQNATPMVIDLNESVETMLKMLRRLIGENIELAWLPAFTDCIVKMDPSHLDQILANLCVNARDAIEDIGKVTIKTETVLLDDTSCKSFAECVPGNYIRLSIIDTGCGMDEKTAQHVFEPFFTTKGLGQGTGLGLATVYGVVKQSHGFIDFHSELGIGTTFDIYIPQHTEELKQEQEQLVHEIPRGHGETVLMVEDDPTLIKMSQIMLERLGYDVLTATTPGEAIELVKQDRRKIRLFLSDVVMPEMNGRELIDRLLLIRPGVKYLFMSGYTADVIINRGVSGEEEYFIQKPFSLHEIAVKIRNILDSQNSDLKTR